MKYILLGILIAALTYGALSVVCVKMLLETKVI